MREQEMAKHQDGTAMTQDSRPEHEQLDRADNLHTTPLRKGPTAPRNAAPTSSSTNTTSPRKPPTTSICIHATNEHQIESIPTSLNGSYSIKFSGVA